MIILHNGLGKFVKFTEIVSIEIEIDGPWWSDAGGCKSTLVRLILRGFTELEYLSIYVCDVKIENESKENNSLHRKEVIRKLFKFNENDGSYELSDIELNGLGISEETIRTIRIAFQEFYNGHSTKRVNSLEIK